MTPEWCASVDASLSELRGLSESNKDEIRHLSNDLGAALGIHSANAQQIANNTMITLEVSKKIDQLSERAMPAIQITEFATKGAEAIGKMLTFFECWGKRVIACGAFVLAVWVGLRVMVSGTGGWLDALRAFVGVDVK